MMFTEEFPKLKNMDEREKFLENYKNWEEWFVNPKTGEKLYRIQVPGEEICIVAKTYLTYSTWSKKNVETVLYYILKPETLNFEDGKKSKSEMKEFLKDIQKK